MTKTLLITIVLILSTIFGLNRVIKSIKKDLKDTKELTKKITLNKVYKNTISPSNLIESYKIEALNNQKEYNFFLKNIGDKSRHPHNYIHFTIEDSLGNVIKFGKLSSITKESKYRFTPYKNGDVYIKFYSKYGDNYYTSKYEFILKSQDNLA